jgi:anti-sigma regulatory factor (Ser/Thr protein kinase)
MPDLGWQTFTQMTLLCLPGDLQPAEDGISVITRRIHGLSVPASRLERIRTALAEACRNILRQAARNEPQLPVCIRVFVSGWAPAKANRGYSDLGARQENGPASIKAGPSGDWGFFLVEKAVDPAWSSQEDAHHSIDLFLYREGEAPA